MGRSTKRLSLMLMCILLFASVGGVFAQWVYPEEKVDPQTDSIPVGIVEFTWAPEEILPTDTPGENYMVLLDSIINNNKAGLNSSKNTIGNAVEKNKLVHSSQNVQGGNLKHLFITEASRDLDFIVQYVTDSEYHVYMYENDDLNSGLVDVTSIKAYKTILVYENGNWKGQESQLGYSVVRYFPGSSKISILPEEWIRGVMPT